MDNSQLNRVMRLVHRTGDRCVVLDNENDEAVVVMNLDEYENILDMSAEPCSCCEDCDDTNDDWSSETAPLASDVPLESDDDFESKAEPLHFSPEEDIIDEISIKDESIVGTENIAPVLENIATDLPVETVQNFANVGQEEPLSDLPSEEADRFYLEPVDE